MVALEVFVNGTRRYVAGHQEARMLNVLLMGSVHGLAGTPTTVGVQASVCIPGGANGQLANLSYPSDRLAVGDEVTIRVVDVDSADPPSERNDGDGSFEIVAE